MPPVKPSYPTGTGPSYKPPRNSPSRFRKRKKSGSKVSTKVSVKGKNKNAPTMDKLTGPLTGRRYRKELKATERKEFGPLQRQLNREEGASNFRRTTEIPIWYQGYQGDIQRLQGQTAGAYSQAGQNLTNMAQQAGQQDASNQAAIMQRLQQDAQARGTTVDPSIDISQGGAQGARQNLLLSLQGTLQGQGANQAAYMNRLGSIAGMARGEAQDREFSRLAGIQEDQRELAAKRGEFRTLFRRQAREDERKHNLELRALGEKGGYNKAIIKQAKLGVKKAKVTGRGQLQTAQQQGENERIKGKQFPKLPGGSQSGGGKKKKKPKKLG